MNKHVLFTLSILVSLIFCLSWRAIVRKKMRGLEAVCGIALLFATSVVATDFYVTSPYDSVSWRTGKPAKITWDIIPGGPEVSSVSVDLMDGDDNNAHVLQPIASGLSPSETSCEWVVPEGFPATNTVFIRVRGQGATSDVHRFSHRFAIQGDAATPQKPQKSQPSQKPSWALETTASFSTLTTAQQTSQISTATSTASESTTSTTSNLPTETNSIPSVTVPTTRYRKNEAAAKFNSAALLALLSLGLFFI